MSPAASRSREGLLEQVLDALRAAKGRGGDAPVPGNGGDGAPSPSGRGGDAPVPGNGGDGAPSPSGRGGDAPVPGNGGDGAPSPSGRGGDAPASPGCVRFFVPGRIEVRCKHSDYAGGRSLVCAVERGFVVAATPRRDDRVQVIDVAGRRVEMLALDPHLPDPDAPWARYPATVFRRVARNFPGARIGADLA
ncbi:MAG: hypothetical protein EHM24_31280, partial [Acidobacteria bacterium]